MAKGKNVETETEDKTEIVTDEPSGKLSIDEANNLVVEHRGWAEAIARAVARAWSLDWQDDGLDGAAYEALIYCSRRFDPERGVPFKGYARKRVHEAATEAARKSKTWLKRLTSDTNKSEDAKASEISAELMTIYPELRSGVLPSYDDDGDPRGALRQMLMSASLLASRDGTDGSGNEDLIDLKRMILTLSSLEPVHQLMLWNMYWDGSSMRSIATEWGVDELSVIREHQSVLTHVQKTIGNKEALKRGFKVRPALKVVAERLKGSDDASKFSNMVARYQEVGGDT
jgi:DNA-directed RNA polymerase specialized sigma subunit